MLGVFGQPPNDQTASDFAIAKLKTKHWNVDNWIETIFLMKNNFTQFNFNNKYFIFIFILEYNFLILFYIYIYYTETLYNVLILMQHRIFLFVM